MRDAPAIVIKTMKAVKSIILSGTFSNFGCLNITTFEPLTREQEDLIVRFTSVFELAFTRFTDLKKAQAAILEAQIEAALERVRAKAMSMQNVIELSDVISLVYREMSDLNLSMDRCFIITVDEVRKGATWWMAEGRQKIHRGYFVPDHDHEPLLKYMEARAKRLPIFEYLLTGKVKQKWDRFLFSKTELRELPSQVIEFMRSVKRVYFTFSTSDFGFVNVASFHPLKPKEIDLMVRFAKVFELAYTRFNDLKKAEAQAREATIQASLERIRGKAMAMHGTRDFADTIHTFYHELASLHLTPIRCGVGLIDKEKHTGDLSTMNTTKDGHSVEALGVISLTGHKVLEGVYENWLLQKDYQPVLRGNEIKEYYKLLKPQINFPDYSDDTVQYGYFFFFPEGGVYAWTDKEMHEDELDIYRRFKTVLSLAYKRYKDLENAEERAQLAIKEASLDRVRAEIASMRNTNDLQRITPLIWKELRTLDISFVRCGVFIMNEITQEIQIFLSNREGAAIAAFDLPYETPGNYVDVIQHWRQKKPYANHWGIKSLEISQTFL
jgi:hypothetical protein